MSDRTRSKAPEFLADLVDHAAATLQEMLGVPAATAQEVAHALADKMRHHWGGQQIYFPKGLAVDITDRDLQLWEEFNGHNHAALARKYNMSIQWVYQRLKAVRAALMGLHQPDMFAD